ncbi:sulfatase [Microbulbifer agarilyticus]|uniref:sulfatase n=1 Tax=Microbulbifer agarilyticus TaxID=260552 RepID=UPI001CD64C9A|nr:sulfatase [Microbulbifer agarilyticus]MCA0900803.1 sulfatase [Microbulbifer agarilyticus]
MSIAAVSTIRGLLAVLVLVAILPANVAAAPLQEPRQNVLFILVDDLNDYIASMGGHPQVQTPNIDQLARQSVQFKHAYTNVPVCSQSRSSLFTGVYPHDSRDFGWTRMDQQFVLRNNKTFLHLFRENGYQLLGTGKLLHNNIKNLWDKWGVPERLNYGPHAFDGTRITGHPSVPEPFRSINIVDGSFAPLNDVPEFSGSATESTHTGWGFPRLPFRYVNETDRDLLPDEAHAVWASEQIRQLDQSDSAQPFFLGVGFVRPHTPLYAPKRFFDLYPLDEIQLPPIKGGDLEDTFFQSHYPPDHIGFHYFNALKASYGEDNEGLRRVIQAYLACITFMDEQVGKVLHALEQSRFRDNTTVVLTSDHGWQFGEKNFLYKNSPWEESTRIPMLWKVPGLTAAGQSIQQPVSLIDIFPTFRALFALEGSHSKRAGAGPVGGHSLLPLLDRDPKTLWSGPQGALTVLGAEINQPIEGLGVRFNRQVPWHIKIIADLPQEYVWQQTYSYRTEDCRYIRYPNGREELYHHRSDPNEWHNLAGEHDYQAVREDLKQQMFALINTNRS